jgi:hypothetical protein
VHPPSGQEAEATDKKLTQLAEQSINPKAAMASR